MTVTTSLTTARPDTALPSGYLRRAGTWLVITTLAYFVVNGAQVFETATVVPAWTAAPPASLALFRGEHGLDFMVFWIVVHSLHELTFLLAIAFSWRIPTVRNRLRRCWGCTSRCGCGRWPTSRPRSSSCRASPGPASIRRCSSAPSSGRT